MTPQTPRSAQPLNTQQAAARKAAAEQAAAEKAAAAKAGASKAAAEKAEAEAKAAAETRASADAKATAEQKATTEPASTPSAETATTATADSATGSQPLASTDSAATGSSVNPWLIGGGVLAAVGIGAAASGGSDSKSSDTAISQPPSGNTDKGNTPQPDTSVTPDNGTNPPAPGTGNAGSSGADSGAGNGAGAGTGTGNAGQGSNEQPGTQPPAPNADQTYTAGGSAAAPTVGHNGITNLGEASFRQSLAEGANAVKIERILSAEGSDADGRVLHFFKEGDADRVTAYEIINVQDGITWHEAVTLARTMGGKLLTIDSADEARALAENLSSRMPETPYDAHTLTTNGAWIGLSQAPDASAPNAGWHWQGGKAFSAADWQTYGFSLDGHKLPADGHLTGNTSETNQANFGVLTAAYQDGANGAPGQFTQAMISDFGNKDTKLTRFVIEYENYEHPLKLSAEGTSGTVVDGQVIQAADLGKLSWVSLLNSGGTIQIIGVKVDENGNPLKDENGNDQTVDGTRHTITLSELAAGTTPAAATPATALAGIDSTRLLSSVLEDQGLLIG